MTEFRERANLRTQTIKELLSELERERDHLLDEIAHKKGEVAHAEKMIKRIYEKVLDVNKEEQAKELQEIKANAEKQKEEFQKVKVGIKTPKNKRG